MGKRFYTAPQPETLPGSAITKVKPQPKDAKESYQVVQAGTVPNWKAYSASGANDIAPPPNEIEKGDK